MLMRQDHEYYKQSTLQMVNWIPTPQGSAVRAPGTRYLQEVGELKARIIPFLTTGNERSLLLFTSSGVKLLRNINDRLEDGARGLPGDPGTGTVIYRKQIVDNFSFFDGIEPWQIEPSEYYSRNGDGPLGVYLNEEQNALYFAPRLYKHNDATVCTAETTCEVDTATNVITLDYQVDYVANPPSNVGGFEFKIEVSANSDYSSPLYIESYNDNDHPVAGSIFNPGTVNATLPSTGWTGTLYIRMTATAQQTTEREYSNPQFRCRYFKVFANGEVELTEADITVDYPYAASDLDDLHYIQSPYGDKELVVTHPRHPPHKFFFNTVAAAYQFIPIVFTGTPSEWAVNNYPATCSSAGGRLVLAGGQSFKVATGDPVASVSETIWATDPGNWSTFTTSAPVVDKDSLQLNTTYRSPIQWVYGHKSLLVGALEMEYIVSATDGLLSPLNAAANMHSTHGSNNVQPAGFGTGVLFPSDGGTKVRKMSYRDEEQGWVAQDLTLYNPEVCYPRIKRMVRMRNPHQMCMVLTRKGQLAIFHSESGIEGWTRYKINGGNITDICVVPDDEGRDVPYLLVKRTIDGTKKLYLEAIPNFSFDEQWAYVDCHLNFNFETPTNVITGLDHLEGRTVHVADQYRFIGSYTVTGGQITLTDDTGSVTNMTTAIVGMSHRSTLTTLPPQKLDPGAKGRYLRFAVRTLGSTRPIINGERVSDRDPLSSMNLSQGLDLLDDWHVATNKWEVHQPIEIMEHLPFRAEILGVYGKMEANSP
jgi:hypothetical protein